MPDATITSTASTFGTITGTFAADQSTVTGTITGIVAGTLTGSVGVPGQQGPTGPQGPQGEPGEGVPVGGTAGQFLTKIDGTNYNTDWTTLNLSAYLTDAPSDGSQYARQSGAWEVVSIPPDYITSVAAGTPLSVNSGELNIDLSAYAQQTWVLDQGFAPLASPAFYGNPTAPTPTFGDNDTSISTTAFVQAALAGGTAVAKNLEVYVRNQTGSTVPAGSIVYISGATGNRPLITLAQANNDANSAQTMGFTKTAIANNGFGYVIVRGELENIDTSALTEGVQLYLSPTTAGTWTTTKPSAPQHLVYVGIVVRAHPTLGVILVAVQNGYELDELHDVAITSPTNGQVLKYNSTTNLWVNGTDSSGVAWGNITGTLGDQTDLSTALNAKLNSATAATTYAALAGATFTGEVVTPASTTANAGLTITPGVAPTTPTNGEIWATTNDLQVRLNGVTETLAEQSWVTAQGYLTSAPVTSVAGRTGAITLAVADVSGAAPLASPSLSGTPLSTTAAADTNTTQIATTAFVVGQAGSATPLQDGTTAVGTSLRYARQDHVHPTDTSRAALASPTFTGVPAAPTAAVDTNTTQLATTAFVVGQAAAATPLVDGTAAVGTSLRYARADHVHPTDTTRAPLASPSLTGTPTAPTATAGTNTTQIATTAFVRADNNVKAWVNFNGTGTVAIRASFNVSSITDNGTGDYTVNFTTAMVDTNYVVNAANAPTVTTGQWRIAFANARGTSPYYQAPTTSACRVIWAQNVATVPDIDSLQCMVSIFR